MENSPLLLGSGEDRKGRCSWCFEISRTCENGRECNLVFFLLPCLARNTAASIFQIRVSKLIYVGLKCS